MLPPTPAIGHTTDADPDGHSYGAVLVAADRSSLPRVQELLQGLRFTGWVTATDKWIIALGQPGDGVVAAKRRGVIEVAAALAAELDQAVFAVRVRNDRQLAIVAWRDGEEIGRYCSNPSVEPEAGREVLSDPVGSEHAAAFAEACGRPEAAAELAGVLEEELDPDSVYESERLLTVLKLLGMPRWLVAAGELPADLMTAPRTKEMLRLRVGRKKIAGILLNMALVKKKRRRRTPPPVIADPPTSAVSGYEGWML